MAKADSTNEKVLDPIGQKLDEIDSLISDVDDANTVQDATSIDQLALLAALVSLEPEEGEPLNEYRTRVLIEYQLNTSQGTLTDLVEAAAEILDVDEESIRWEEPLNVGEIRLGFPSDGLNNVALTPSEFADALTRLAAASYRIDPFTLGTFTYITPTDYSNDAHDPDLGYDGLDTGGNPKGNGGTYAGLIN